MNITLAFNPEKLEQGTPLYWLFRLNGVGLKFWILWGCHHLTSQHFAPKCLRFHEALTGTKRRDTILKPESEYEYSDWAEVPRTDADPIAFIGEDYQPQAFTIGHFADTFHRFGFSNRHFGSTSEASSLMWFLKKYWDYINPSVHKCVTYQYKRDNGVTVKVKVGDVYMRKIHEWEED